VASLIAAAMIKNFGELQLNTAALTMIQFA